MVNGLDYWWKRNKKTTRYFKRITSMKRKIILSLIKRIRVLIQERDNYKAAYEKAFQNMIAAKNGRRSKVRAAFDSRKSRNNRYSMRAFARDLDIDVAALSRVLSGQSSFSQRTWDKIKGHLIDCN